MTAQTFSSAACSLIAAAVLAACGADAAPTGEWTGTVDTLADGVVHVRNPAAGEWDPADAWRLVEELRIGTAMGTGPELFGSVIDLEVDAYGRIWVLDRQANELRVFDADGRHLRTIGREGGGPGEFNRPVGLAWDPDGNLWVADTRNARYSVFDTTGEYVASHRSPIAGVMVPWPGGIDTEGRLYDYAFDRDGRQLIRFDTAMQPVDTFAVPDHDGEYFEHVSDDGGSRMRASVPFAPSMVRRVDPRGYRWAGVTDRYRVVQRSMHGDTLRIIDREYTPIEVTDGEKDEAMDGLEWFTRQGGEVDRSRIPDVKPAYRGLFVDDRGFLWVLPSTAAEDDGRRFDIFDPGGRYLGRVQTDHEFYSYRSPVVRGDRLYTMVRDGMDVQYIIRARIDGREDAGR